MEAWHIELRRGHSRGGQSRYVICNEQGERVAVVSLNGAPDGDPEKARLNAALLASGPELNDKFLELEELHAAVLTACMELTRELSIWVAGGDMSHEKAKTACDMGRAALH